VTARTLWPESLLVPSLCKGSRGSFLPGGGWSWRCTWRVDIRGYHITLFADRYRVLFLHYRSLSKTQTFSWLTRYPVASPTTMHATTLSQ
jgi:hypothetical protein